MATRMGDEIFANRHGGPELKPPAPPREAPELTAARARAQNGSGVLRRRGDALALPGDSSRGTADAARGRAARERVIF